MSLKQSNVTPKRRSKPAAKPSSPPPSRRRASQRARGVEIQLGYPGKLRPMMIEHSRTEAATYLTVYAGVRGEFLAAGVPANLLPTEGSLEFEISQHHGDPMRATMSALGVDRWELEIDWGHEMPRDDGHPAICELARMMLIDLGYWRGIPGSLKAPDDLEYPIKELLADERATDFKQSSTRLQISSDFHQRLSEMAQELFLQVHRYGEVFPVPAQAKQAQPKSRLALVVDNSSTG